jgi:hypothetical protein
LPYICNMALFPVVSSYFVESPSEKPPKPTTHTGILCGPRARAKFKKYAKPKKSM